MNGLNLAPLGPLDGGRIVHAISPAAFVGGFGLSMYGLSQLYSSATLSSLMMDPIGTGLTGLIVGVGALQVYNIFTGNNMYTKEFMRIGTKKRIGVTALYFATMIGIGAAAYSYTEYMNADKNEWDRLEKEGKLEEAEPFARQCLSRKIETLGVDDRNTLTTTVLLGFLLNDQGKSDEAELLFRRALEGSERLL